MIFFCLSANVGHAQTRDELEKQRLQLKKEIEETEKLLNSNRAVTKENLLQYNLILRKLSLQSSVIENINKDLGVIDNSMYFIYKDLGHYNRLLDTLKKQYARSMIYAYKNRNNYDFLSFIFSAGSFNDAMKRINYLKSYRAYREMQAENILRTQQLRKKKIADLNGVKMQKNQVLGTQNKELSQLEIQQQEKDRIIEQLKKQGSVLNNQIAGKKKQMLKVSNAITSAIKQAQIEAKKELEKKNPTVVKTNVKTNIKKTTTSTTTTKSTTTKTTATSSTLLNETNTVLNNNFEKNRGALPWPLDRGIVIMHYGQNTLPSGTVMDVSSVTISADIGTSVKAVFDGTVSLVKQIDNMYVVIIQHGKYFSSYSNITGVSVQKGQQIKTGQVLGKVAANFDGVGAIDFYISNESSNFDPEKWLRRR